MTQTTKTSAALAVLKETIGDKRPPAMTAQSTGVRFLNILKSTGWQATRRRLAVEEVLRLAAIVICVDILSQDIGKATLRLYERVPGGGKRIVEPMEHPIAELLATEPNRHHTWYQFIEMVMLHMALVQNAFVAKRQTSDGRILELIPVMPARTTILAVLPEDDLLFGMGYYAFRVDRNTPHERIQLAQLPDVFLQDEFIHFKARMFDGLMGYSNLETGSKLFGQLDELQDYQTRLFNSDGQMPGVFKMGKESGDSVSEEAFERLRDQLAESSRKMREEQRPIVLEEGMTFESIAMNAEQAEAPAARDAAVIDAARLFRIPPHKIFQLQNVKYENMETLEKSYVNDTLIPYCKRLEPVLNRSLLSKKDRQRYFCEFDRREMLLNDLRVLSEVAKVLLQNSALELDEARQLFGFNQLANEAGRSRLMPSTYNLVDQNNEVIVPAGAQPANDDKGETSSKDTDE